MKIIREYTATLTMEIRTNSWADYEVEEGEEPDTEELSEQRDCQQVAERRVPKRHRC